MLRQTFVTVALIAVVGVVLQAGQSRIIETGTEPTVYSEDAINGAIDHGVRDRIDRIQHSCTAEIGGFWNKLNEAFTSVEGAYGSYHGIRRFSVTGQPPLARVAGLAQAAQERYIPVPGAGDDEVQAILADDVFTVWVLPDSRGSVITAARLADTGVEHLVIRPRGDSEGRYTVQPLTIDVAGSDTVANLFGASVQLEGVIATFQSAAVIEIAKDADVEAILITTGGEFKCNLDDTRILRGYGLKD